MLDCVCSAVIDGHEICRKTEKTCRGCDDFECDEKYDDLYVWDVEAWERYPTFWIVH